MGSLRDLAIFRWPLAIYVVLILFLSPVTVSVDSDASYDGTFEEDGIIRASRIGKYIIDDKHRKAIVKPLTTTSVPAGRSFRRA